MKIESIHDLEFELDQYIFFLNNNFQETTILEFQTNLYSKSTFATEKTERKKHLSQPPNDSKLTIRN